MSLHCQGRGRSDTSPLVLVREGGQGDRRGLPWHVSWLAIKNWSWNVQNGDCMLCWSYVLCTCMVMHSSRSLVFNCQQTQCLLVWHNISHCNSHSHITMCKSCVASPTRVTCSLHSYCWLHYVNYYNYQLLVMELFCGADTLVVVWDLAVYIFTGTGSSEYRWRCTSCRTNTAKGIVLAVYHTHKTYICITHG